jgi:hypothetical protein
MALQPLLDWIRAACMHASVEDGDHCLLSDAPSYPHPPIRSLDRAIETCLKRDLPEIIPNTGPDTSTTSAINHLTVEMLQVNQASNRKPKTVQATMTKGLSSSCMSRMPPPSNTSPRSIRTWRNPPSAWSARLLKSTCAPLPTCSACSTKYLQPPPDLLKKVASYDYSHFDQQDLEVGIHPFCTTYRSP